MNKKKLVNKVMVVAAASAITLTSLAGPVNVFAQEAVASSPLFTLTSPIDVQLVGQTTIRPGASSYTVNVRTQNDNGDWVPYAGLELLAISSSSESWKHDDQAVVTDANGNATVQLPNGQVFANNDTTGIVVNNTNLGLASYIVQRDSSVSPPTIMPITSSDTKVTGWWGGYEMGDRVEMRTMDDPTIRYANVITKGGSYTYNLTSTFAPGTVVMVRVRDIYGKYSEFNTRIVTKSETAAPFAPTLNPLTNMDTVITGNGEADADVKVTLPNGFNVTGRTDGSGAFSVTIPKQKEGDKVQVTLTDDFGNVGATAEVTVTDAMGPVAPIVNPVLVGETTLTGKTEANATVEITLPDGAYKTITAEADGSFTTSIPAQEAGAIIKVVATDVNGNKGAEATVVVGDSALEAPVLNNITNLDTTITGKGADGATVTVTANGVDYTATVANGVFSVTVPKQTAGTTVTATQTKNGVTSEMASKVVTDGSTAPGKVTLDPMDNHKTALTGKGTPGLTAETTIAGKTYTAKIDASGHFSITIPKQKADTIISVHEVNETGVKGTDTKVKVYNHIPSLTSGKIVVNDVYPEQQAITGTAPADAELVRLVVNGVAQRNVQVVDGEFSIYSRFVTDSTGKSVRLKAGDVVEVDYGNKTPANQVAKTIVIKEIVKPTINATAAKAEHITGSVPVGTQTLRLIVNGVAQRVITPTITTGGGINADGTFSFYSRFVKDAQGNSVRLQAGDVITIDYGVQVSGDTASSITVK
ncbi:Ig-like domain-containing protein [Listeria rustica]|uniref:Bacterial Ig domain-containing protein n=1 Tax=Listeria rustica TaxID=2713503 RepID=A0A7W1T5A7_9LIST|nr:Ig-like domain-containing protein [Listeria rustica]MBA3925596.1 hypothetical protein [Listeria rustica]